jgi:hypothetical protein
VSDDAALATCPTCGRMAVEFSIDVDAAQ